MNASRIVVGTLGALAISTSAQVAAAPHATIAIRSLNGQIVKVVRWRMGDPRVRLTVSYDATLRRTSAFGASVPHAVAALNGDFFTWGRHRPAGLTIVSRRMYSAGWQGAPTAGYAPGGRVVFGLVRALPIGVYLNHRRYGVVLNRRVVAPGTVIVYNRPGTRVVVLRGWYAVVAHSAFGQTVVPARGIPRALALHHPGSEMPVERVSLTATRARRVPFRSALLLVRRRTAAYRDLTAVMHRESPGVLANVADPGWAAVSSTIGGKPYLVLNGRPIRERPSYVELGSWTCRCMRSAVATFENGSAGLVEIRSGDDLQAARTLKAMGVVTAMGFDSGGSADLWTARGTGGCTWGQRGRCFTANPGGERLIPDATVLSVH
ncbi:MAG: phosphodiester glycosidase family protein [Gaiellales bacterium]